MTEMIKIYVWPDGVWYSEEDIVDIEWLGKSDDYSEHLVPIELEADDIEELISLNALPGMLIDAQVTPIENMGKVEIPEGAVVIIHHSKDIEYKATTMLEDKLIINAPNIFIEVIMPKEKKDE